MMKLSRSIAAVAFAAIAAAGCLSKPAIQKQYFALRAPTVEAPTPTTLAIASIDLSPHLIERGIVYRLSDHEYERDPYAEWMMDPKDMVAAAVLGHFRANGIVGIAPKDRELGTALTVEELSGDFRGESPAAEVVILAVSRTLTGEVRSILVSEREPVVDRTAAEVVAALDRALQRGIAGFATSPAFRQPPAALKR